MDKEDLPKYFRKRGFSSLYYQIKYNGTRAIWDGSKLLSRGGHIRTSVPHIVSALKKHSPGKTLDGELFTPKLSFNRINGASRKIESSFESLQLDYYIFDTLDKERTFEERILTIESFPHTYTSCIKPVLSYLISPEQILRPLEKTLANGHEGIVLRNPNSLYREGRHVGNLWGVKPVYELEAAFVCFLEGETDLHADTFGSILLRDTNGRTFSCSGFTEEDRVDLWRNPPKEGTPITINFGTWSQEDRMKAVPLYPRFKAVRKEL